MSGWGNKKQRRDVSRGRGRGWDASGGNPGPTPFSAPPAFRYPRGYYGDDGGGRGSGRGSGSGRGNTRFGRGWNNQRYGGGHHIHYGPAKRQWNDPRRGAPMSHQNPVPPQGARSYQSHDSSGYYGPASQVGNNLPMDANGQEFDEEDHEDQPALDNTEDSDIPVLTKPWKEMSRYERIQVFVSKHSLIK